jgi:hypothetical protein
MDYREAVRRGDLTAAGAASARFAANWDPDRDDPRLCYDDDELGFFSSIWEEAIPSHGIIDDLVDAGDLPGALKELDHLVDYIEGALDHGQPMRIVGWLGEATPPDSTHDSPRGEPIDTSAPFIKSRGGTGGDSRPVLAAVTCG